MYNVIIRGVRFSWDPGKDLGKRKRKNDSSDLSQKCDTERAEAIWTGKTMKKEYDFSKLKKAKPKYMKELKNSITMRLDPHVIGYFKKLSEKTGLPYQSLINFVLHDYASQNLEPTSNWPKKKT